MEVDIVIDVGSNIRKHKVIGVFSKELLLESLNKVYSDPDLGLEMNSIWDFSNADLTSFTLDDIEEVAEFVQGHLSTRDQHKTALVAPELAARYMAQKYAKKFENYWSRDVRVFDYPDDAVNWVKQAI